MEKHVSDVITYKKGPLSILAVFNCINQIYTAISLFRYFFKKNKEVRHPASI
jgi:hypothetical protein